MTTMITMTSIIEGNNFVGLLLKPLLNKVTRVVGLRMLWKAVILFWNILA
jgi:hypothetical protein